MSKFAASVMLCALSACASQPVSMHVQKSPEILTVFDDGTMVFKDRYVNLDDVVIYPDGFGGEHAAIKMRTPSKPDYYRDSIIVQRIASHMEQSPEYPAEN